jgi:hypothetical protein
MAMVSVVRTAGEFLELLAYPVVHLGAISKVLGGYQQSVPSWAFGRHGRLGEFHSCDVVELLKRMV